MSDDVHHHIRIYKKVAMALGVLTVVTVAVSYIDFAVPMAITVALIIAATKGSLVVSCFMHLMEEKKVVPLSKWGFGTILATLVVTVFFFLVVLCGVAVCSSWWNYGDKHLPEVRQASLRGVCPL